MSIHINRFIDRIKAGESRGQRDFTMTMSEAKDLHGEITKLLLTLETMRSDSTTTSQEESVIKVELTGGTF